MGEFNNSILFTGQNNLPSWINPEPVPDWFKQRYGYRNSLTGWTSKLNDSLANKNLELNGHGNAASLGTVYQKNYDYINTPATVSGDIQSYYNSVGKGLSPEDFVNLYNTNAQKIRDYWNYSQRYKNYYTKETFNHNQLFSQMFPSRSNKLLTPGSGYNIGYQKNIEGRNGSSTWLRRMDQYENEFDFTNPDKNRLHEIKLDDGTTVTVYKKANGDIGLYNKDILSPEGFNNIVSNYDFNDKPFNTPPSEQVVTAPITRGETTETGGEAAGQSGGNGTSRIIVGGGGDKEPSTWQQIGGGLQKIFGNPNLLGFGRLAGTLINNEKIYDEALKGINPILKQSYHTHRQVVGDEATKQAYYRRAAQGQTRAAQAFTSDADRQMAYQMEAKRVGDELRAQGDLADNQEIRRTSDESNQHQWANTQRDTEVANYNIESLIKADAARHNLLSQKHAAQWSSIDNYLKTIETRRRQKQEEFDALRDQEFTLAEQDYIYSDTYQNEYNRYEAAKKKAQDSNGLFLPTSSDEYKAYEKAKKRWNDFQLRYKKEQLERLKQYRINGVIPDVSQYDWSWVDALKSGGKVTRKKKDDLLYKSTRDVVEHFRKMSKLSSDALNRRGPKIERLAEHPKGKTKKYQYGGVAPFTVWTPAVSGGETSYESSRSSSKSSSKSEKNEGLDLLKELFKLLNTEGLPSDTNIMYAQMMQFLSEKNQFGNDISIDDVATMYVSMLNRISNIKFNKQQFDNAQKIIDAKNAAGEFAVDSAGRVAVQNRETGKIEYKLPDALEKGDIPLTNNDLLQHRSFNTNLAFDQGTVLSVASNATSMSEIAKFLKENLPKIEKDITEKYNTQQAGYLHEGINLLKDALKGIYKSKNTTQLNQARAALQYLYGVLPPQMQNFLLANAKLRGTDPTQLISSLISSNIGESIEFDAVTGKGSNNDDDLDKIKSNPLLAMQRGIGGVDSRMNIITKDSNTRISVDGKQYTYLNNVKEDMSIDKMLYESEIIKGVENKRGITLGDQEIDPIYLKDIMYSNNGGVVTTLPCKIVNGHKEVNLAIKDLYEEAENEAYKIVGDRTSNKYKEVLGEKLHEKHLDSLLKSNGYPNKEMFGQFLVVEAYTTDRVPFDKNSQYIEKVNNPDTNLEQRMSTALSTDDKKSNYTIDVDDNGFLGSWIGEGSYDDIYRANVFIPLDQNPVSTMMDSGTVKQQQDLEELYQISKKSTSYNNNNNLE